jgi:dipeptidyl aminopeptidase/acylaminoacyl peptidase
LRKSDGTQLQTISKANTDGLKELKWSPPEEFIVKAADEKTDLYGIIFKPYDFDPTKKYPVLDHIYNGPYRTQVARRFIGRGLWAQAMAQLGFVVIMVDGRGTTERGKEFQDVVYHNFGRNEVPDHVATLKQLAKDRPYIDMERAGIFGGSWGGYMTTRAMVLAPDVYKVGVSIYPVVDLYDHNALAIEYYMGLPQSNKEAYDYASSIMMADKLKGKLLLIHGTADINATFSATMKMVEAFVRANKPFDLIVLPDLDHSITGQSGKYILDSTKRYFQEHLRPRQK